MNSKNARTTRVVLIWRLIHSPLLSWTDCFAYGMAQWCHPQSRHASPKHSFLRPVLSSFYTSNEVHPHVAPLALSDISEQSELVSAQH